MLTERDDFFHPPTKEPQDWAETAWFACYLADRDIVLWFYPLFRSGLGVMSCGVYVYGPGQAEPWELLYYRQAWHMPIPEEITGPCDFLLPNSLRYKVIKPLMNYRIDFEDEEFSANLSFEALHEPHPLGVTEEVGHLDQFCRVRGEVMLHGERIEVDDVGMRDRTWGPRREHRQMTRLGYSYGARLEDGDVAAAFHASSRMISSDESRFMTGFLLERGRKTDLSNVARTVHRDFRGRPVAIDLALTSQDGTVRQVTGAVQGQMTLFTSPYIVWISSVRWTLPDGSVVVGEDQDTWSPGRLRRFLRTRHRRQSVDPAARIG